MSRGSVGLSAKPSGAEWNFTIIENPIVKKHTKIIHDTLTWGFTRDEGLAWNVSNDDREASRPLELECINF